VWRLTDRLQCKECSDDCVDTGFPKSVSQAFGGFPLATSVDAVFQRSNGNIYLFTNTPTGVVYYRYTDKYIVPGQDPMKTVLPDVVDAGFIAQPITDFGIELADVAGLTMIAAFQRPNGKIYFFFRKDASTVVFFRLTDGYDSNGMPFNILDAGYNARPLESDFTGVPQEFLSTLYQRTQSNKLIYWIAAPNPTGPQVQATCFDQWITKPATCVPCHTEDPTQD